MFEPINRKSPEDRRSVPLDPDSLPTILQGQVLQTDANDFAVLADGAAFVPDPMWAFTKTGRLDVDTANTVTTTVTSARRPRATPWSRAPAATSASSQS